MGIWIGFYLRLWDRKCDRKVGYARCIKGRLEVTGSCHRGSCPDTWLCPNERRQTQVPQRVEIALEDVGIVRAWAPHLHMWSMLNFISGNVQESTSQITQGFECTILASLCSLFCVIVTILPSSHF